MRINILTNNGCPNSRAFNFPLLEARPYFKENGCELRFHFGRMSSVFDGEVLFINSNVFRPYWKKRKEDIFHFLEKANSRGVKIMWFDTTDSTWCTQLEVLPHVDLFLKSQLFKDRSQYLKRFRTGRIFTDSFEDLYKAGEEDTEYHIPPDGTFLDKMAVSWNTCFENYTEKRHGLAAKISQAMRPLTHRFFMSRTEIPFTPVAKKRQLKVSCRIGTKHSRPSVVAHRKAIVTKLEDFLTKSAKVSLKKYFTELRNAQVGVGPFGVGEITLRDFEIIICGATLAKPDMGHLETWPNLFAPQETYMPFRWDLSDFEDTMEELLLNSGLRISLANEAQKVYMRALSEEGMREFAGRLLSHIKRITAEESDSRKDTDGAESAEPKAAPAETNPETKTADEDTAKDG